MMMAFTGRDHLYVAVLIGFIKGVHSFHPHHQLSALQVRRLEQNTALNATTKQFIIGKISGNALKQGSRTHSVLRQRSSQLQKYKAAH